jgi:hypothetical protein
VADPSAEYRSMTSPRLLRRGCCQTVTGAFPVADEHTCPSLEVAESCASALGSPTPCAVPLELLNETPAMTVVWMAQRSVVCSALNCDARPACLAACLAAEVAAQAVV